MYFQFISKKPETEKKGCSLFILGGRGNMTSVLQGGEGLFFALPSSIYTPLKCNTFDQVQCHTCIHLAVSCLLKLYCQPAVAQYSLRPAPLQSAQTLARKRALFYVSCYFLLQKTVDTAILGSCGHYWPTDEEEHDACAAIGEG